MHLVLNGEITYVKKSHKIININNINHDDLAILQTRDLRSNAHKELPYIIYRAVNRSKRVRYYLYHTQILIVKPKPRPRPAEYKIYRSILDFSGSRVEFGFTRTPFPFFYFFLVK